MNDSMPMKVFQGDDDIRNEKFGFFLIKELSISEMVSQISTIEVIHDHIQVLPVLKSINHIN